MARRLRSGDEAEVELRPSISGVGAECSFLPLGLVISLPSTIPVPGVLFSFSFLEVTLPFRLT